MVNSRITALAASIVFGVFGCSDDDSGTASTNSQNAQNSANSLAMDAGGDLSNVDSGGSTTSDLGGMSDLGAMDGGVQADGGMEADDGMSGEDGGTDMGTPTTVPDPGNVGDLQSQSATFNGFSSGAADVPLTIYLPTGPGPYPAVIFHHGFRLSPDEYASYGTHLASWGFVVIMPDMPSGTLLSPSTHVELKGFLLDLVDFVATEGGDMNGPFGGLVDVDNIGLTGHSLGGKISFLAATEESRIDAVFGIDPVDAGPPFTLTPAEFPSVAPELMGQISAPIGVVGETVNSTCTGFGCQSCAPADDNFQQYFAAATSPALEIEIANANHMSFLDDPSCGFVCNACPAGTDDVAVTRRLTQRYLTAFMLRHLKGEDAMAYWLKGDGIAADVAAGLVSSQTKGGY